MVKRHRMLSFLVCIALVTAFFGCASTPTRESSGQYVDDSSITTRVKAAILIVLILSPFPPGPIRGEASRGRYRTFRP